MSMDEISIEELGDLRGTLSYLNEDDETLYAFEEIFEEDIIEDEEAWMEEEFSQPHSPDMRRIFNE